MKIILASSNKGKIEEIQKLLPHMEVIPYSQIIKLQDIEETGETFQENAIIKATAVDKMLKEINYDEKYIVISDDSGISVDALGNEPGIYSARYAGKNATDKLNNEKLVSKLKEKNIKSTPAHYTASIAVCFNNNVYTVHGWMYGYVIDEQKGSKGFGYDPMFIPQGFKETLGELNESVKKDLSHRTKALKLAMLLINSLTK